MSIGETAQTTELFVPALHEHGEGKYAMLFEKRDGTITRSEYCTACIPETGDSNKHRLKKLGRYYLGCPHCGQFASYLHEGSHQWCAECKSCSGSTSHAISHIAGGCKACTKPAVAEEQHAWCSICRMCRPFGQAHFHYYEQSERKSSWIEKVSDS